MSTGIDRSGRVHLCDPNRPGKALCGRKVTAQAAQRSACNDCLGRALMAGTDGTWSCGGEE